jgi:transposase
VAPGCNESAGRVKSAATRPGNRYLKAALGIAALSAARSKDTYYNAKFKRIAARRARMIALVALEHTMITDAYNMLCNGAFYRDPGPDYYPPPPAKNKNRAIKQLEALGYNVTLEPRTKAA